jgi:hypothetical protein
MTMKCYVVGYAPRESKLYEDLEDFPIGTVFKWEEVRCGVNDGIFPPGLILQVPGGEACVVVGRYGEQEVVRLLEHVVGKKLIADSSSPKKNASESYGRF